VVRNVFDIVGFLEGVKNELCHTIVGCCLACQNGVGEGARAGERDATKVAFCERCAMALAEVSFVPRQNGGLSCFWFLDALPLFCLFWRLAVGRDHDMA
jgi:hypothetical protein